jgi:hypothetical protein
MGKNDQSGPVKGYHIQKVASFVEVFFLKSGLASSFDELVFHDIDLDRDFSRFAPPVVVRS